jgi:hypothetical protein
MVLSAGKGESLHGFEYDKKAANTKTGFAQY